MSSPALSFLACHCEPAGITAARFGRVARDLHAIDPAAVGAIDFEPPAALGHLRAGIGYAPQRREDQPCDGLVIVASEIRLELLVEHLHAEKTADQVGA